MSQLVAIFCDLDDFCKVFEPLYEQHLLAKAAKHRRRQTALSLSEIMTLVIDFHRSHYRDFKAYYLLQVWGHLRPYFPKLVSYHRFVELMPRALVALSVYLQTRLGESTGIAFIDSTSLSVCHNRRIQSHKVFKHLAQRGKTSMGWFYGFKLHLIINDEGELLACRVTAGNVDDRAPVCLLSRGLVGQLFGDKGYISQPLHDELWGQGLELLTGIRKNMKPRLLRLWDKLMLRKRAVIEAVNDQLKNISQIEHTRHRSVTGFMVNVVAGLIAYTYHPTKPSLGLRHQQPLTMID
jgi:Transposase DDE domain